MTGRTGVRFPARKKIFFSKSPDRFLGPVSLFAVVLGVLSLRVKWPRREADHAPPSSVDVKIEFGNTAASPHATMVLTGTAYFLVL